MPITPNVTLSNTAHLVDREVEGVVKSPLSHANFTLDSSGVAGFFGGESAVRAMATVNLVPQRRWCGWYNAPGSYEVAKQYSALAKSNILDGLFPGGERDPAKVLMIDGQVGPKYISVHAPTTVLPRIGHLGFLLARKASQMPIKHMFPPRTRHTMNARVTFVRLNRMPGEFDKLDLIPSSTITFALGTILISVGGCVACVLVADWFCLASIALGILANGVACLVIGSGKLVLRHNIPAQVNDPGDVVLRTDTEIVVLVGSEGAVSPFTRARFVLQYDGKPEFVPEQLQNRTKDQDGVAATQNKVVITCGCGNSANVSCTPCSQSTGNVRPSVRARITHEQLVRISVLLLLSQFLAQLLLIPQGTLFGQVMFIATLVPSWMYHSYLSSLSLDLQTETLFKQLSIMEGADIYRYQLNTWAEAVVFTCLTLASIRPRTEQRNLRALLDGLLPSQADVWQAWKDSLVRRLKDTDWGYVDGNREFEFTVKDESLPEDATSNLIQGQDLERLRMYQQDAKNALEAWRNVRNSSEIQSLRRMA